MSLTTSYSEFNQQLLLKLTLGQQFKQVIKIPKELQDYIPKEIDSAQDLLVLNQYWGLMQLAGYQTRAVPEKVQKSFGEIDQIQNEKQLDDELVQILKWIVAQESPFYIRIGLIKFLNLLNSSSK